MTDRQSLSDFVDKLPSRTGPVLRETATAMAFLGHPVAPPGYIWPDVIPPVDSASASIVLITAPGAMGKSAAARAISERLNVPLIDVARLPVGSHSLTGLLTQVLAFTPAASYVQALRAGKASLVLDGLDEAEFELWTRPLPCLSGGCGQPRTPRRSD